MSNRSPDVIQLPPPQLGRSGWPWQASKLRQDNPEENYPVITVVTPSYNQGEYIEETIRSVLLQGYPNLEYIVIDGGSTDGTVEIIQKYADFLTSWVSEADAGQANAINKGFSRSTGDIMGWLNSDDMLAPGALYRIAREFMHQPQTQVVTGLRQIINQESQFVRNALTWLPECEVLQRYCVVMQETTYWRRRVWDKLGPLDEAYDFALDYAYWLRMLHAGFRFKFLPAYLGLFREHSGAKSTRMLDLRERELSQLYQLYAIADSETTALEQLNTIIGRGWQQKMRLLKEFGQKNWSKQPYLYYAFFHLINSPIIGPLITDLHRQYNRLRKRPFYM